ncbi:pantothenate kinase [Umbelopsis sp. PMI_123]|nr:pantothenate kinase [Umbelopsis sp. PMI_123]
MMNIIGARLSPDTRASNETRDIYLPNQTEQVSQIAIDIGGSLTKIVYYTSTPGIQGGKLHFTRFETDCIDNGIELVVRLLQESQNSTRSSVAPHVVATGGGAHLYYEKLQEAFPGIPIQKEDEMECLIIGLNFFIQQIPREVFSYSEATGMCFEETPTVLYPYMLVNIGSGVSILKVTGPDNYVRISGTSLGGGTLWGLLSLLTDAKSFDEMLEMSQHGDNRNVDLLVGDIYGSDYSKLGLKSSKIASSFGKVFRKGEKKGQKSFKSADISRSLLYMISNNIGQIAYLNAQQHGLKRIYFGGGFIRGHPVTMNTLSYAINFWSQGNIRALFLRHEGYLGAAGAFLKHQLHSGPVSDKLP